MTKPLLALLSFLLVLPAATRADDLYHIKHLSEKEMLELYTVTLRDACHHADQFWTNAAFDSRAGYWGTGSTKDMNEGTRAISEMVFTCSVLARYSDAFTNNAEREAYIQKAISALRFVTATHVSGTQKCTDGKQWGNHWQSAMWTATFGFGAWMLWDKLDADLQKDVERVVGHEADRFLGGKPPGGSFNDTKAEENGWNLICLSLAANMFTNNPHAAAWYEKAQEYAMNTFSAPQDRDDKTKVDGKPVSEWFAGENVHSDFTLENHGFFHPSYIGCSSYFLTQPAMQFTFAHRPVPQAMSHHQMDVWHMFQGILFETGESAYPQGMDWELHCLPFINLYASLASYKKDAFAARLEQNILQYMRAWQLMGHGSLAFPGSSLGFTRHAINCEQISYGFLAHKLFGPPVKAISTHEIAKMESGVRRYNDIQLITHRTKEKFLSMSWTNRILGMLIPIDSGHEDNPDFTVPIVNGFIGTFDLDPPGKPKENKSLVTEHSWKETKDGFETTGTILLDGGRLKQTVQLVSLGDKTVVYSDRVVALKDVTVTHEHGIPLGIENDEITGSTRTVTHQDGKQVYDARHPQSSPLVITGPWANVDGRLGAVLASPGKLSYQQAKGYSPGISVCTDILSASSLENPKQFKAGEEVARRVAIFYVEISPHKTAELAASAMLRGDKSDLLLFKLPNDQYATVKLQ
jgi:hypothetical protein